MSLFLLIFLPFVVAILIYPVTLLMAVHSKKFRRRFVHPISFSPDDIDKVVIKGRFPRLPDEQIEILAALKATWIEQPQDTMRGHIRRMAAWAEYQYVCKKVEKEIALNTWLGYP